MSKLISIMLGILFLASCGEHTELEQPIVNDGEIVAVTKEIQVSVLSMQSVGGGSTRSALDKPKADEAITMTYRNDAATTRVQDAMIAAESKIHNAYIVQFNGTSPTSTAAWVSGDIKSQLSSSSITCHFAMTAGVKNRVYVIANRVTAPTVGMTLAAFEAPVPLAPSRAVPATGLPRSAMQDVYLGEFFDVFQLKSVLAKLSFGFSVDDTEDTEYADFHWVDIIRAELKGVPIGYSFYAPEPGDFVARPADMTYTSHEFEVSGHSYSTVFYIPENLSGRNSTLIEPYERALETAPANSIYLTADLDLYHQNSGIQAEITCNWLLGDSSASDFNFVRGCFYKLYGYIYGTYEGDLRIIIR